MGQIQKGILGGFSGKVGPVVGGNWRGIQYMRSLPTRKKNGSISAAQQLQRNKFGVVTKLLQPLREMLNLTYAEQGSNLGFGRAVSYNLKHGLTVSGEAVQPNYPQLVLAQGVLPTVTLQQAASVTNQTLLVQWANNAGAGKASAEDATVIAVVCSNPLLSRYWLGDATREDGSQSLNLSSFSGTTVYVYFTLLAANSKIAANSMYLGSFPIS